MAVTPIHPHAHEQAVSARRPWLVALVCLALYLGAGLLVVWMEQGTGPSLWYPPIVVGVTMLLLLGWRFWPLILIGDLAVAWLQYDHQVRDALIVASNTTIECVLAWRFLASSGAARRWASRPDFALRLGLMALVVAGVGSTMGTVLLVRFSSGNPPTAESWLTWWLGDATTLLTLMPAALLTFVSPDDIRPRSRRFDESFALFLVTALVGLSHVLAGSGFANFVVSGLMLGMIPVLWAALRYDLRTTAWVVALISLCSVFGMRLHPSDLLTPLTQIGPQRLVLQGNLVVLALAGFALAQVIHGERQSRAALVRAAEDLRVQVMHTRLAQRSGRTGSWECNLDGSEALWSDEVFALFDRDPAQGVPTRAELLAMVAPESRAVLAQSFRSIEEGRAEADHPIAVPTADGRTKWHHVRWELHAIGGRTRVVGTHTDITELVQRRQAADHLAALVSTAAEAILTVDREHRIRTWNASAERLFGWSASQAIGRSFFELVPENRSAVKLIRLRRAFEGERLEIEFGELRAADGHTLHLSMSISPVRDASGEVVEAAIMCGDLSRQRELEEQLMQAQKMEVVGRLAGGIAHDFNNMLTAILGFSELLRPRVVHDTEASQSVEQVVLAAERASSLTQRLLAFSRRRARAAERIEVETLLQRLVPLFRRLLGEDLELEVRTHAPGAQVHMDPTQLEQVLLNLVINARDAMPLGGRITLETLRLPDDPARPALDPGLPGGPTVLIRVSDTGVGMDAKTRSRIFEPFFTTKESGRGTGLGLSTVMAIVQEVHGAIRVQSAPGEGATFSVHLPEADPLGSEVALRSQTPRAVQGGVERILVVEDEPLVRDFLVACLRSAGYQVELASSAEQALEWALDHELAFDLLVTDIVLPRLSGVELVRRLREVRAALPVLFLSGYGEAVFEGRLQGPLLSKPFTRETLLAAVREVLEAHARTVAPIVG